MDEVIAKIEAIISSLERELAKKRAEYKAVEIEIARLEMRLGQTIQ